MLARRSFLIGLVAAPVIVRAGSLMPVRLMVPLARPSAVWVGVEDHPAMASFRTIHEVADRRFWGKADSRNVPQRIVRATL